MLAYKPGKELVLADTLSRAYLELSPETNEFEEVARLDTVHWLGEVNAILDAELNYRVISRSTPSSDADRPSNDSPCGNNCEWLNGCEWLARQER